jgi:uroporphyrin-3 C-methyltransferase/uroporphyrinogen III methyltransferase/synthase
VLAHDPLAQHPAPETHSPAASVQPPAAATSKAGTEAIETKSVEPSAPPVPSWGARLREGLDGKEFNLKLIVGLLAFLLGLQWWSARNDISDLRRELAQRLQSGDNMNIQTKLIANRVDDEMKLVQGKVAVLEAKQVESQGQQLALEQLYQDLAKNRDDWALAEIEQVLSTASQQLQLAGNVRGALIALQNADSRLARTDRPQFITIRRAIAKDTDNLKSLPNVDLTGIAVRLDALVAQIDQMPLLSDAKPAVVAPAPKSKLASPTPSDAKVSEDWRGVALERWNSWSSDLWNELRQLVRVRVVGTPEALLLSPGEAFFARENLKLRLLNARLALLSRNDAAFRSDLAEADRALVRYFEIRSRQTQAARELIKQLQESVLNIEMPTLSHSLAAVRQSRSRP